MPAAFDLNDKSGGAEIGSGAGSSVLGNSLVGTRLRAGCSGALALIQAEYGGDAIIRGVI